MSSNDPWYVGPSGLPTSRPTARTPSPRRRPSVQDRLAWPLVAMGMLLLGVIGGPLLYFHVMSARTPAVLRLPVGPGATTGPITGSFKLAKGSEVEYRVDEILFGQHHTAVGRTAKVTGTMGITGVTVTSAHFSVDMSSVVSDQPSRDAQFRNYILDTSSHPSGSFTLTRAIDLGTVPAPDQVITEEATGALSLRGVTQQVTFLLHAQRNGRGLDVTGAIPLRFARWRIPVPNFAVARVSDTGVIDVLLHFVPIG